MVVVMDEVPLWMQGNGDLDRPSYAARRDRQIFAELVSEGVLGGGSLLVAQRGAGADNSVDVAAGRGVIDGDDQTDQGSYLIRSAATENVPVTAAPVADKRRDLIIARIRDGNAGGGDIGDEYDWVLEHVPGVDIDPVDPDPPATPDSSIVLATLLRSVGDTTITTAMITDARPFGALKLPLAAAIETKYPHAGTATSGANYALDFDLASIHDVTLSAACTFSFTDPPNGALVGTLTLVLRNGGTAYAATWPASVKWAGGTAPTLSGINKADVITFTTFDGGTTWAGMVVPDFSALGV